MCFFNAIGFIFDIAAFIVLLFVFIYLNYTIYITSYSIGLGVSFFILYYFSMPMWLNLTFAIAAIWTFPILIAVLKNHREMEKIIGGALSVILWPFALLVAVTEN